jgi:D-3-phosphoglycerate dehydrogenase
MHAGGDAPLIGRREFSLMKRGAFLLNCARGSLIDETSLIAALDEGRVAGAWLDCFTEEPYAGPLTSYPQVMLTPHAGSYTAECRRRMEMEAADNLVNFFKEAG